tara:strand:- start:140 stop:352 length:213 start_codon:yes stop_codon:yes gene_type:complete
MQIECSTCGELIYVEVVKERMRHGNRETAAIVMVAELADRVQQVKLKPVYTYGIRVALEIRDYAREQEDV